MSDERSLRVDRVIQTLTLRPDLMTKVAEFIVRDGLTTEETYEFAEEVCVAAFGKRVECPECATLVLPGFLCWGCEEWTAPAKAGGGDHA